MLIPATAPESGELLWALAARLPGLALSLGESLPTERNGKINNLVLHPVLLKRMAGQPNAAEELAARLCNIGASMEWATAMAKSMGSSTLFRSVYLDERGQLCGMSVTARNAPCGEPPPADMAQNPAQEEISYLSHEDLGRMIAAATGGSAALRLNTTI